LVLKATEFRKITQDNGHYGVQGHSRSSLSVWVDATSYVGLRIIVTYILSCTVSKISRIIGRILTVDKGCLCLSHSFGVNP